MFHLMSKWKVLESETILKSGFFRVRVDKCELPDGRVMPRYYVLEFPDWVNVVPFTNDGKIILLEQHRHGAGNDFLEIPGGSTHPGQNEDPRLAGERELLEETGYRAKEWIHCGHHFPNPALQNNRMHTYVALGCEKVAERRLDPYEDMQTVIMDWEEALRRYQDGEFAHSLIAASIGLSLKVLKARGFRTS
jgi:8-oxo-dGTP pyrophosphatase MutT (NUDIX family)